VAGAVQPRLASGDLDPQQRRSLRLREPFQVPQDQHVPLVGAEPPQGLDDLQAQFGPVLGRSLGDLLDRDLPGASLGQPERLPHRDAPQPAPQRGRLAKRRRFLSSWIIVSCIASSPSWSAIEPQIRPT